jgi:predicted lipoprotein with Yx(FWY)xxD motif
MKNKLLLSSLIVLALIVSACASATPAPATVAPVVPVAAQTTDTPAVAMPSGPAEVDIAQNPSMGSILVDSKGMTLYLFTNDTPNTSTCYNGCAKAWPPLLTTGAPTAGTGANASMLGTTTRTDGTTQVTYNNWPLYYWAKDMAAGDTTGENVQNVWFVITPAGLKK